MATTDFLHAQMSKHLGYHSLLLLRCNYQLNGSVIIKMMPNFLQAIVVLKL